MSKALNPRLRAATLLVLVAGFGFVAGIITDRLLLSPSAVAADAAPQSRPEGIAILLREPDAQARPADGRYRLVLPTRMAEELNLSAEQQAEIERILADDQAELRELTEQVQPSLAAVVERSRQRIHAVLTEEQIERWHAMPRRLIRGAGPDTGRN